MSEGDVSLIQDEDVLRRMWQQTDDFGRRKEIRAHMYRLREERLRDLYGGAGGAPGEDGGPKGAPRGTHTDSFADQCFQSLKSKETRDSESPTREYAYKLQDTADADVLAATDAGWTVMSKNEVSDDGKTHSKKMIAHTAGEREVDGGNATYAGLKESDNSITQHEDENSKFIRQEASAKSAAVENFEKHTEDGGVSTSVKSSVSTSRTQSSTSKKFEAHGDEVDNACNLMDMADDVSRLNSNVEKSDISNQQKINRNTNQTNSTRTNSVRNQESNIADEGVLVSRKVEHPDEFTKVIIETRTLPDGSTVTSTSRETRGAFVSRSGNTASSQYDSRNKISTSEKKSYHDTETRRGNDDKPANEYTVTHVDDDAEHISTRNVIDKHTVDARNSENKVNESTRRTNIETSRSVNKNSDVVSTDDYESARVVNQSTSQFDTDSITSNKHTDDQSKTRKNIDVYDVSDTCSVKSNKMDNKDYKVEHVKEIITKIVDDVKHVDEKVLDSEYPKPDVTEFTDDKFYKKTTGEYTTTYQTDYTSKRVSQELSPTHEAWARSLRASPENPLRGGSPTRSSSRSLKSSTTSLRSSISPDKKPYEDNRKRTDRSQSPKKSVPSSTARSSSSDRKTTTSKTISESQRSSSERQIKDKYANIIGGASQPPNSRESSPGKSPDRYKRPSYDSKTPRTYERSPPRSGSPTKYPGTVKTETTRTTHSYNAETESSARRAADRKNSYGSPTISPTRRPSSKSPSRPVPSESPEKTLPKSPPTGRSPSMSPTRIPKSTSPTRYSPPRSPTHSTLNSEPVYDYPSVSPTRVTSKSPSPTRISPSNKSPSRYSPSQSPTRTYPLRSPGYESPSLSPTRKPISKYPTSDSPTKPHYSSYKPSSPTRGSPSTSPTRQSPSKSPSCVYQSDTRRSPAGSPTRPSKPSTTYSYSPPSVSPSRGSPPRSPVKNSTYTPYYDRKTSPSPTRKSPTKDSKPTRSRDSSPTTSVSEIEFISSNKNSHLVTNLDDIEIEITDNKYQYDDTDYRNPSCVLNVSKENVSILTDKSDTYGKETISSILKKSEIVTSEEITTDVKRKSSLKKTLIKTDPVNEVTPKTFEVSPYDDFTPPHDPHRIVKKDGVEIPDKPVEKKPKERPPFVRSETYEERCRKILGMPDKKTLVEGAEKNLSEILGILPNDKTPSKSPSPARSSPYSSPERELSAGTKSAELIRKPGDSEFPTPRKSSLKKTDGQQYRNLVDAEYITVDTDGAVRSADTIDKRTDITHDKLTSKKNDSSHFIENELNNEKENRSLSPAKIRCSPTKESFGSPLDVSTPKKKIPEKTQDSPRSHSPEKVMETAKKATTTKKDTVDTETKSNTFTRKSSTTKATTNVARSVSPVKEAPKMPTKSSMTVCTDKTALPSNKLPDKALPVLKPDAKKPATTGTIRTASPDTHSPNRHSSPSQIPRSSSPDKGHPRNLSPNKKTPEKVTTHIPAAVKTAAKFPKESPEKGVPSKNMPYDNKKLNTYKNNIGKSSPVDTPKKYEPTRTILSTQKYDIFKNDKRVDDVSKKISSTSNITRKTITQKNEKNTTTIMKNSSEKDKKKIIVDSDSECETEKVQPRRKSIELRRRHTDDNKHIDSVNSKINRSPARGPKEKFPHVDTKITRTTSDITMKTTKTSPVRIKSKPEINVTRTITTKTVTNGTVGNKNVTGKMQNVTTKTTKTNTTHKTTNTTLNTLLLTDKVDEDIIIDIQHAKSSRENSPDRICPLPVDTNETGKPRFPDRVTEPDDYVHKKKTTRHETISEADSMNNLNEKIIEISDEETDDIKTNINKVRGSDECLLTVNEKVSKFLNTTDKVKSITEIKKQQQFKKVVSDEVEENLKSDECLLSVSDKVSKFAKVSDTKRKKVDEQANVVRDFIKHEVGSDLENDECLLSVNDKVSRFLITAEKISEPIKLTDPAPKVDRPDLTMVDEDLKTDECLLSVSDKVNKFINTAEKLTTAEKSPGLVSKASKMINDVKSKFEQFDNTEVHLNVQKDTIASQARKSSTENKNIKRQPSPEKSAPKASPTPDRSVNTKPITTLRSSEAVKKAKALFENITTQKSDILPADVPYKKGGAKLTDIGVYKKSPTVESVPDVVPKSEVDNSSVCTESESEVDIAPNVKSGKVQYSNGTYNRPGNHPRGSFDADSLLDTNKKELPSKNVKQTEHRVDSANKAIDKHDGNIKSTKTSMTSTKTITSTCPIEMTIKYTKDSEVSAGEFVSTRRGSGKFGVELRKTSTDQSFVSERRRSSAGEPHVQPTIEDIHDLALLEQMLEKVTGYEQRRRIRSQIRIVRKNMENTGRSESFNDRSTKSAASKMKNASLTREEVKSSTTEHRRSSHVREDDTHSRSPGRKQSKQTTVTESVINPATKRVVSKSVTENTYVRSPSPGKKTTSPERRRDSSPGKRNRKISNDRVVSTSDRKTSTTTTESYRNTSPDGRNRKQSPDKYSGPVRPKTSKVSEYTTAYLRKIGVSNNLKPEAIPKIPNVRKDKEEKVATEYHSSYTRKASNTSERIEETYLSTKENGFNGRTHTRSPSPGKRTESPVDKLYRRSPSPDLKRPKEQTAKPKTTYHDTKPQVEHKDLKPKSELQDVFSSFKTKTSSKDLFNKATKLKEEKPEWATTNILRKTSEARTFTTKKIDDKNKTIKRSQSPSKTTRKPTDVITSSYGVGPTDENGKPLFGIRALRKQNGGSSQNYEVKGTIIRQEFHSENGGAPVGQVTMTAYSSNPEDLQPYVEGTDCRRGSRGAITSVTTTTKYGNTTGNSMSKTYKQTTQHKAIENIPAEDQPRVVRRGSVKTLTEKFIKNAVETTKTEKSSYPKAGLILRTSSFQDNGSEGMSTRSSTPGIIRTDSNNSVNSTEMCSGSVERRHHTTTSSSSTSFLDSRTKVTGVQDILTRMKNADIVVEDGDTMEDAEARALLNKFLGATVLMAGMEGYVADKQPRQQVKQESRTVVTKSTTVCTDIEDIWDERVLRKLLEESSDYEERRKLRARLRQVMAEQEACAQIVADAATSGCPARRSPGESSPPSPPSPPSSGSPALSAPLLCDVQAALCRLQGALRHGAAPPAGQADLLELVARLQAGLLASPAPRQPRPPRRHRRSARHTVGVTREELADARKIIEDMNFPLPAEREPPAPLLPAVDVRGASPYALRKQASLGLVLPPGRPPLSAPQTPLSAPQTPLSVPPSVPQTPVKNATARPFVLARQDDEPKRFRVLARDDPRDAVPGRAAEDPVLPCDPESALPGLRRAAIETRPPPEPVLRESVSLDGSDRYADADVARIIRESIALAAQTEPEKKSPEDDAVSSSGSSDYEDIPAIKTNIVLQKDKPIELQVSSHPHVVRNFPRVNGELSPNRNFKRPVFCKPILPLNLDSKLSDGNRNVTAFDKFASDPQQPDRKAIVNGGYRVPEDSKPINRFSSKKNRMKRANTIDIPKPLHCYQVDSDDEGDKNGDSSLSPLDANGEIKPKIPQFKPKTDNDRKFLAFIQKHNDGDSNSLWTHNSPAAQRNGGCNWSSCFGSIKNVFEGSTADNSRSSSSASANKFWKAADDSVNFAKPSNFGPKLTKSSVTHLNNLHDIKKKESKLPWASNTRGDVITGSLIVKAPNAPNVPNQGFMNGKLVKPIPKPNPVNQFSHAPMSAFKPPPKKSLPQPPVYPASQQPTSYPQIWSPPSVPGKVKQLTKVDNKIEPKSAILNNGVNRSDRNSLIITKPPLEKTPVAAVLPWAANNSSKENRVLNLAAKKFEKVDPPEEEPKQHPLHIPPYKEKNFNPINVQNEPPLGKRFSLPQNLPSTGALSAPHLVRKLENLKQHFQDDKSVINEYPTTKIDAEKLQIEFYEKQIRENSKNLPKPSADKPASRRFSEYIPSPPPQQDYMYTVTDYTPPCLSAFVPLPQIPDIEENKPQQPSKKLPDLVLNNLSHPSKNSPVISPLPNQPLIFNNNLESPCSNKSSPEIIETENNEKENSVSDSLSQTEYKAVTKVMKAPVSLQAVVKPKNNQETYERRDSAAKSLKGVLQKFSSPKHDVITQIEKKKTENQEPNSPPSSNNAEERDPLKSLQVFSKAAKPRPTTMLINPSLISNNNHIQNNIKGNHKGAVIPTIKYCEATPIKNYNMNAFNFNQQQSPDASKTFNHNNYYPQEKPKDRAYASDSLEINENEKISTVETSTTTAKNSNVSSKVTESAPKAVKPVSPFAKFRQLDKQNSQSTPSSPSTPLTPGGGSPLFRFTDPALAASATNIKERLLQWCRDKTRDYENVKLDNFSTSWSDGLAFCALIHHFLPDEFEYSKLQAKQRRHNFTLAFKVADEKAGIYPLLDVEDMVTMRKPDWKCVFTYVQAIHRRFKDQD